MQSLFQSVIYNRYIFPYNKHGSKCINEFTPLYRYRYPYIVLSHMFAQSLKMDYIHNKILHRVNSVSQPVNSSYLVRLLEAFSSKPLRKLRKEKVELFLLKNKLRIDFRNFYLLQSALIHAEYKEATPLEFTIESGENNAPR